MRKARGRAQRRIFGSARRTRLELGLLPLLAKAAAASSSEKITSQHRGVAFVQKRAAGIYYICIGLERVCDTCLDLLTDGHMVLVVGFDTHDVMGVSHVTCLSTDRSSELKTSKLSLGWMVWRTLGSPSVVEAQGRDVPT